jgi:hypothetical protein
LTEVVYRPYWEQHLTGYMYKFIVNFKNYSVESNNLYTTQEGAVKAGKRFVESLRKGE